ncbi:calpain-A-like [Diprion similis]|uniref:calpain-A-like n=1 Tax=Diprion similis TaxID=362088 RepID=UPI001EF81A39|nr:calpain-A-like [Diprion similis]
MSNTKIIEVPENDSQENEGASTSSPRINESRRDNVSETNKEGDGEFQDFHRIKRELCSKGKLFEDPLFPAVYTSLFPKEIPKNRTAYKYVKWVRPKEIVSEPKFFVDGVSRFDIEQHGFGNCWLIAAISRLAMDPELLFQVVPQDQDFDENYAGIFHFRFWRYGKWIEVVIDDRLPRLGTARSSEVTEFWSALLVKAYAKFYGSWEATEDGESNEAWQDFTGGLTSVYDLDVARPIPFELLLDAQEKKLLMGCGTPKILKKREGLYSNHAYCITQVSKYKGKDMVRLRNPWGHEEWTGRFCDDDPVWKADVEMAKALNVKADEDGEFWMPFELVSDYFAALEICDTLNVGTKQLEIITFEGEWKYETSAKGHLRTLSQNPQYRITLEKSNQPEENCTIIVALLQKNRRTKRLKNLRIGFEIYQLDDSEKSPNPLDMNFFQKNESISGCGPIGTNREVQRKFELVPGVYCIIPCVYRESSSNKGVEFLAFSDEEEQFLLRVFLGNSNTLI